MLQVFGKSLHLGRLHASGFRQVAALGQVACFRFSASRYTWASCMLQGDFGKLPHLRPSCMLQGDFGKLLHLGRLQLQGGCGKLLHAAQAKVHIQKWSDPVATHVQHTNK